METTMHGRIWLGLALLGALLFASPAYAGGILLLEDGRIFEQDKMERVEGGVKLVFENGEITVPDALIQEAIFDGVPTYEPKNDKERAKLEKGLVPWQGKWVKQSKLPGLVAKYIAKRRAEVEDIRAHQLWRNKWTEETKHFEFEYTIPPYVLEYYRDLLEAYYKEFAKTWKIKTPKGYGRLKVCCYTDRPKFHQISGAPFGALAYFRFAKPIELNFYYDRLDPEGTEQVMYHEASHYLQMLLDPGFKMPHFPGEALAEYYGASKFDPATQKLTTGLVLEGRLAEVKGEILAGNMKSLEKMLTTNGDYHHYTWGWTLAHWLMQDKKTGRKFEKFVKDLVSGKGVKHEPFMAGKVTVPMKGVWEHFKKVFDLKTEDDVKAFEEAWHAYVKDDLKLESGRGLEQAAKRAMGVGRKHRAKRLYKEALDAGTTNPRTYLEYAEILEWDNSRDEALTYYRKAVELGPLEAAFYAALGKALHQAGQEDEGGRYVKLAQELDPDSPWLANEIKWLSVESGN